MSSKKIASRVALDEIDRALINRLQDGLPIVAAPFQEIAFELGIAEAEVCNRIDRLLSSRVLTRFGPFFDAAAMGGAFCLCAMAVPEQRFERVAQIVNSHHEVAHNYERAHALNMWFVLATESEAGIETVAQAIEKETGLAVLLFPKLEEYFVGFRVAA